MQPDLFAERARIGIRRARDHAESATPGWTEGAARAIRDYAARGAAFLIEDVTYTPPPDGRAWGAATRLAVKRGWIKKVGYAPANSSNKSPKCLWSAVDGFPFQVQRSEPHA